MGQYDDISQERLRADLVRFAKLILRLEEEGGLLTSPADLQKILGELRQKLFAWEIRSSRHLGQPREEGSGSPREEPAGAESPSLRESLRVVREAIRREEELLKEWMGEDDRERDD
jgi:hypothetical protein